MKKELFAFLACLLSLSAVAQINPENTTPANLEGMSVPKKKRVSSNPRLVYQSHSWYLQASTGAPNMLRTIWRNYESMGTFASTRTLPWTIKVERTLDNGWGITLGASHVGGKYSWRKAVPDSNGMAVLYDQNFSYANTSYFAGVHYHLYFNELLGVYASGSLGLNRNSFLTYNEGTGRSISMVNPTNPAPLFYNVALGGRVHFTRRFGMYAEVGYGRLNIVNLGFDYRLNKVRVKNSRGKVSKE
jgi:hypothetical protein